MRHILSLLVENEVGALSRISGLFSARAFNIESLSVAQSEIPGISRLSAQVILAGRRINVVLVFLVMGTSQAMKAALFEDLLGLIPPITFLVVSRIRRRLHVPTALRRAPCRGSGS